MIVITGATGQLGRLVITELLKTTEASQIVAAVRNIDKAQDLAALGIIVRHADYTEPPTLDAAFDGASKILLISSSDIGQRVSQHRNVVDAAKRVGVKLLAYTSLLHANTSTLGLATEHVATEALIDSSGLPFTLLRNGWYLENHTANLAPAAIHGMQIGSAGKGRISAASRADYAAAAAMVLKLDHPAPIYELAGDHAFTLDELIAEAARVSGKPVIYQDLPESQFKAALLDYGLPESVATMVSDSEARASEGALFDDSRTLSKLIGYPTQTLQAAVEVGLAIHAATMSGIQ